jgi:hypothetical protein
MDVWNNFLKDHTSHFPTIMQPNSHLDCMSYENQEVIGINIPQMFLTGMCSIFGLHCEDECGFSLSMGLLPPTELTTTWPMSTNDFHKVWQFVRPTNHQTEFNWTEVYKKVYIHISIFLWNYLIGFFSG